jgi:SulP family sulfate permease
MSLGLTNIAAGLFGAYPLCHGSAGLTAHIRFGARTAGSTFIAGFLCILLSLAFPRELFRVLSSIPAWLFGLMLLYVGLAHARLVFDLTEKRAAALGMGFAALVSNNLTYALAVGFLVLHAPQFLPQFKKEIL